MAVWDCTPNGIFNTTSFTPAIRNAMNTATWSTSITFTNALNTYSGFNALIANGNGGLWIVNSQIQLYRDEDAALVGGTGGLTGAAGQTALVTVDPVARTITVSGLTSGNGTFSWAAGTTTLFASGSVGVGRYTDGSYGPFAGTVGDVTYTTAALTLAADSRAYTVTPTAAALKYGRKLVASSTTVTVTPTAAALIGPSTYTLHADPAPAITVTPTAATLSRTRVLKANAASITVTPSNATFTVAGGIELGNYGFTAQIYGAGGTPCRVTMSVTAGSAILIGRGGKISDFSTVPTASVGTFKFIDQSRELADWVGYGSALYILRNNSGGTNVNFDCNVTSFDEHSVHATEIKGVNTVAAHLWNQQANAGAASTQSIGSITVDRETAFVVDWWGAHPVGGGDHVVSCTLNGVAMTDLGGWTVDNPNGYVQTKRFIRIVPAGTYSALVSHSPTQGAMLRMVALQPDRIMSAEAPTYTVTPTAANLARGRILAANSVSYTTTPTAATLRKGVALVASSVAYTTTPTAATLRTARRLVAASVSVTVTPTAATLKVGRRVVASSASYTTTATAASLRMGRRLAADTRAYAVTPVDATLTKSAALTLVASPAFYAVTPSPATLRIARRLVSASVGYTTTAIAATLTYTSNDKILAADPVSYVVTAMAANLVYSAAIIPAVEVGEPAGTIALVTPVGASATVDP